MEASWRRDRLVRLVGQHMTRFLFHMASTFAVVLATLSPSIAKDAPMMPAPGETFYFGRLVIDIKAQDAQVPRVDPETVAAYEQLGLKDEFYLGQTDDAGRLLYLETWTRDFLDEVPPDQIVAGKPLKDYDVPIKGNDTSQQVPQFFLPDGEGWTPVAPEQTKGETRMIRLRWLKALGGNAINKDAEMLSQYLASVTRYSYGPDGQLLQITRETSGSDTGPVVIFPVP